MKILVPVDFSDASKTALQYAIPLAIHQHAEIRVLHAYYPDIDPRNPEHTLYLKPPVEMESITRKRLEHFVAETLEKTTGADKVKMFLQVSEGFAANQIIRQSAIPGTSWVLMGVQKGHTLRKKLLGSVSRSIALQTRCPAIFIPEGTIYRDFANIIYACDYRSVKPAAIKRIILFAARFGARVHFVHVKDEYSFPMDTAWFDKIIQQSAPFVPFTVTTIQDHSTIQGLNHYCDQIEADLIAIATKEHGFFDSFFHKSISDELVVQAGAPLMLLRIPD